MTTYRVYCEGTHYYQYREYVMPEQAQHSSMSTAAEIIKRAIDAGHVAPQVMAHYLRGIADQLDPPHAQEPPDATKAATPHKPPHTKS